MKTFTDLGVFGAFLSAKVADVHRASQLGLRDAAELIQHDARERIGTYQGGVGGFAAWAELSDFTKAEREKQGYTPNDPLLRSGELRQAIELALEENYAVVGVAHASVGEDGRDIGDIAVDQEMGTHSGGRGSHGIPPRPFLGPAGYAKGLEASHAIAQAVGDNIAGLPHRPYKSGSFTEELPF